MLKYRIPNSRNMVNVIEAKLMDEAVLTEASDEARDLYNKSRFGALKKMSVTLSLFEGLYLLEKKKISIKSNKI